MKTVSNIDESHCIYTICPADNATAGSLGRRRAGQLRFGFVAVSAGHIVYKFLSFKKPLLKFLWKKSILYVQCKGNEKVPQRMTDIGSRRQSKLC
jgi:hypothetical protein